MTAHAEEVTLVCNYQYIGPSLHDPAGEVVDMSARITINLDSGRVRGYESAAVFAVSRIDGTVDGGAIGWKYEGKCTMS
jgi:hypothetical protein